MHESVGPSRPAEEPEAAGTGADAGTGGTGSEGFGSGTDPGGTQAGDADPSGDLTDPGVDSDGTDAGPDPDLGQPDTVDADADPEPARPADTDATPEPTNAEADADADPDAAEPHTPRWWARPATLSMTALAAIAVLTLATIAQSKGSEAGTDAKPAAAGSSAPSAATPPPAATPAATTPLTATPTTTPPTATPTATASPTTAPPTPAPAPTTDAHAAAIAASAAATTVRKAIAGLPDTGDLAVAVTSLDDDPDLGSTAYDTSKDAHNTYDTASIVKVDILATLLLRHQHAGTRLTSSERTLATAMIERSDNDAATDLWHAIGGGSGLAAANRTLGLDGTESGPGDLWGLTQTTPEDQLTLLKAVFGGGHTPLSSASRTYIQGLMGSITAGQRWGVSAADSDNAGFALKNGWLERTATGLWDVNSIGEVTYGGHRLLIAVLSSGQHSEQSGIDLVESAARAAARAFTA